MVVLQELLVNLQVPVVLVLLIHHIHPLAEVEEQEVVLIFLVPLKMGVQEEVVLSKMVQEELEIPHQQLLVKVIMVVILTLVLELVVVEEVHQVPHLVPQKVLEHLIQ